MEVCISEIRPVVVTIQDFTVRSSADFVEETSISLSDCSALCGMNDVCQMASFSINADSRLGTCFMYPSGEPSALPPNQGHIYYMISKDQQEVMREYRVSKVGIVSCNIVQQTHYVIICAVNLRVVVNGMKSVRWPYWERLLLPEYNGN